MPRRSSLPTGGAAKRLADIVVSITALIVLSPLLLLIAMLIALTIGRPIIFAHTRVGLNGRPFRCFKFRTMVNGADGLLAQYLAQDPELARQWHQGQKLERDPRVTALGALLRKTSLDELPQLFNVLRGNMSCVGPRPIVASELERYGNAVEEYLQTRPGLTGLWQVSGRSNVSYAKRVSLDCLYVRNWSMSLDIAIMLRTIPVLLRFGDAS